MQPDDVPLREAADPNSNVMATLRWDIVTRADTQSTTSGAPFMKVRTADGREGWVETKYLRSPIDYRAGLVKTGEGWKIEALVAGD
ncbi:MAG TPA: SH3 domain-containing protein [Thermoanaerobaculia bacterium]|nr:SH3 domain-containing protein [Thermoanaerobaculia bacterium]